MGALLLEISADLNSLNPATLHDEAFASCTGTQLDVACPLSLARPDPSVFGTITLQGQSPATGTIRGRILNPTSGQYVPNAEVRTSGGLFATSADGGFYVLDNVPAGPATVTVTYTGYRAATSTVMVTAGQTAVQDFQLVSALAQTGADGAPIELSAFTVSSEREGNAKAIMQQKNSMNITNAVASDVFGDVAEGNVGEFLKHMPGVELDLVQGEIRTIRLRGLDSEYTSVTLDGMSISSADANQGASGNARAFSFEQVSLSSVESIEVSKTISADVDANAPAGTINLKTKRAFDREGRRIGISANLTAFSTRFNFDDSYGPDDRKSRKIHPGGIFDYSDVFFSGRLGINLNISESMAYSANARTTVTYNYTPTAADTRPVVPTAVNFLHAPRTNRRSTVNLTSDFKATDRLVLSLGVLYNYADLNNPQRSLTFNLAPASTVSGVITGRGSVLGDQALTKVTTSSTVANVVSNPAAIVKLGQTVTLTPKFEYKFDNLVIEGKFVASDSMSWYDPRGRRGSIRDAGGPTLGGISYTMERSGALSADWKVQQTGGLDFSDGANYTSTTLTSDDGRFARTQNLAGEVVGTWKTAKFLPIIWKTGVKRRLEARDFLVDTESLRYNIIGAPARGVYGPYRSPFPFDMGGTNTDASARSISGGEVWMPNLVALGTLFRDRPELFSNVMSADNFYNAYVVNTKKYDETIDAAFLMGTARLGRSMTLRAGLRNEITRGDSLDFDPLSGDEVRSAGFPVATTGAASGRATTIPGLQYQYFSRPRVHRKSKYDHWFPSASFKYSISPRLDLQLGYSSTIRRPPFRDITGVWTINEESFIVTAPNTRLKPETSKNYAARLAYYFEPVGIVAVNVFQNTVTGLFQTNDLSAEEFGYNGEEDLSAYIFRTTIQSENDVELRGMELEYSQSLSFLPKPFSGLGVRASYTRNYASVKKANLIPHSIN
ncbi:MAG TPA: TonB-dependent receptor, partial [Opitutaceae bacterium]|nr:TonB-dependent receptor [Opitutaceae bacterium]